MFVLKGIYVLHLFQILNDYVRNVYCIGKNYVKKINLNVMKTYIKTYKPTPSATETSLSSYFKIYIF